MDGQTLAAYTASIGTSWARGIDASSTMDPYSAGIRRRVLPTLGQLPVSMVTAGVIDRAIDLTWMADAGTDLYVLQRVAGHQDPAVTARYLHPDHAALLAAGTRFSTWWGQNGDLTPALVDPATSAGGA
jgi:hypothetical protein